MGEKKPVKSEFRPWRLLQASLKSFNAHHGLANAGNMAFIGLLSVFPFLIVLIALSGLIGQTEFGFQSIQFIYDNLPSSVVAQVKGPIDLVVSETSTNFLTLSLVIALWTSVRGAGAARSAVMKAFEVKYPKVSHALLGYLQNLVVVIGAVVLIMVTLFVLVTGPAVIDLLQRWIPISEDVAGSWRFARYVLSPMALTLSLYLLYLTFTPNYRKRKISYLPGIFLALGIWFAMAAGFSFYLKYLGDLNLIYGSLTGVIILQLFLYLLSIGFILGAELNARYTEDNNPGK